MKKCILILLTLALLPIFLARADRQPETIRIAILKGVDAVRIDGIGVLATNAKGEPLRLDFPLDVRKSRDGLTVNGKAVRVLIASAPVYAAVNGKKYHGVIECLPDSRGILVINELALEEYLVGLINSEISSQWPMESVKAQAVIARAYALYQKAARRTPLYDLESNVMDQVYDGCDIEDSRAARGVRETAGEVVTYKGNIIQAFYHSNCGGHTEAAENVWGASLPYLQGVECRYCRNAPSLRWEQKISLKKLETQLRAAGFNISGLKDIQPGMRNGSGRLADLNLITARGHQNIPAPKFRMAIGSTVIKSTNFEFKIADDSVYFSGTGYGHGIGLCQWGAKQRATDGFDYREILAYYYPGVELKKLYE